jgi:hypothetical protein
MKNSVFLITIIALSSNFAFAFEPIPIDGTTNGITCGILGSKLGPCSESGSECNVYTIDEQGIYYSDNGTDAYLRESVGQRVQIVVNRRVVVQVGRVSSCD